MGERWFYLYLNGLCCFTAGSIGFLVSEHPAQFLFVWCGGISAGMFAGYYRWRGEEMRTWRELIGPDSCLRKAKEDEMIFVLLGRDKAAPATIRYWCQERIRTGKNQPDDDQIIEALACARTMEEESRD